MLATDLLLDSTYDLTITAGGDFATGLSDVQHINLLLACSPGDWRADGRVGVGLRDYLLAPYGPQQQAALEQLLAAQLTADGYVVASVDASDLTALNLIATRP